MQTAVDLDFLTFRKSIRIAGFETIASNKGIHRHACVQVRLPEVGVLEWITRDRGFPLREIDRSENFLRCDGRCRRISATVKLFVCTTSGDHYGYEAERESLSHQKYHGCSFQIMSSLYEMWTFAVR